jgi:hypothetical protein
VWLSNLVVEGRIELRRRLLLSVGIAIGAVALLAILAASSLAAEPPVSFAAPITTEMPGSEEALSGALAIADFNADGHADAVAYSGNYQTHTQSLEAAVSEVTGGGTTWNWQPLTPSAVEEFHGGAVATADMNPRTDALPDVVALTESEIEGHSVVAVYLDSGDANLAAPVETTVPGVANGLTVADVNGDGIPDVLIPTVVEKVTGGEAEVVTLLGEGDGHFRAPIISPIDASESIFDVLASAIVVGDFTGSGHVDIAVSQEFSPVHDAFVMSGDGAGHFTVRTELALGAGSYGLASGDFDGNGHTDLALPIGDLKPGGGGLVADERIATALGDGSGSFTSSVPEEPKWEAENPYSYGIRSADLNGDGRPDLLLPVSSDPGEGGVWALLGNGDGTFSTADRKGLESEKVWAAEAGDFDGGRADDIAALVSPRGPGKLYLAIYDNTSEPSLTLGASSLDLGTAEVEKATTAQLAITNSGNYGLSVSSLAIGGADAADFSVSGCTAAPIAPGATCDATVRFAPSLAGSRGATLTISSDAPAQPSTTVALTGTGASAHPGGGEPSDSSGGLGNSAGNDSKTGTPVGTKPKEGKLTLARTASVSKSGLAKLKLTCAGACTGKLTLSGALKKIKGKSKAVATKIGSTSYALGSRSETLTVRLYAAARAALASTPSHRLAATVGVTPAAGAPSKTKLTLIAPPHH